MSDLVDIFSSSARKAGAEICRLPDTEQVGEYVRECVGGSVLLPSFATSGRLGLAAALTNAGCTVAAGGNLRPAAAGADAGVTGANFGIAETGTVVLESTLEDIRLASTLPPKHFVLLDPRKIIVDSLAANELLRRFHQKQSRNYLAYITGPSRTADIERVLTIGVHGPKELHILLVEGLSDDFLEM